MNTLTSSECDALHESLAEETYQQFAERLGLNDAKMKAAIELDKENQCYQRKNLKP
jgi:hypothetical protein